MQITNKVEKYEIMNTWLRRLRDKKEGRESFWYLHDVKLLKKLVKMKKLICKRKKNCFETKKLENSRYKCNVPKTQERGGRRKDVFRQGYRKARPKK